MNSSLFDTISKVKTGHFEQLSKQQVNEFMTLRDVRFKPQERMEEFKAFVVSLRD